MRTKLLYLFCIMLYTVETKAWESGLMLGAKSAGAGNCGLTAKDVWSVNNNPAFMSLNTGSGFGFTVQNRFGVSGLNAGALAVSLLTDAGSIGFYGSSLGNSAYNQYSAGLSFSKTFAPNFAMGITLFYSGIQVQEYGSFGAPAFNVGFAFPFNDRLTGGFKINNPTRSRILHITDERMQASAALGFSQRVSKSTHFFTEAEVFENYPLDFRCGFEYSPQEKYAVRAGFSTLRKSVTFGLSYEKGIRVIIGFSYHSRLGFSSTFDSQFYVGNSKAD